MKRDKKFQDYCSNFVDKLLNDLPEGERVSGENIIKFSNINSYNLLIIQNLMINWKIELQKLKSPYFDFENPQVRKGLEKFANLLSRNISIQKDEFRTLALDTLVQVLTLISSPYEYFNQLILREDMKWLSISDFEETTKYIKINRHVMDAFVKQLKEKDMKSVYGANDLLDQVFEKLSQPPENPDKHLKEFSNMLELDSSILFPESIEDPVSQKETKKEKSVSIKTEDSQQPKEKIALHERFQDNRETLADKHYRQPISDIRKSLSLNQRFMFINILFEGDESQFNQIIDKVESMNNLGEAKNYFDSHFDWDEEMEEVQEFLEIIEKRFF